MSTIDALLWATGLIGFTVVGGVGGGIVIGRWTQRRRDRNNQT